MKYICLLAFLALTAISCKKDSGKPEEELKTEPDLLRGSLKTSNFYYIDGTYYVKHYSYDNRGKLIKDEDKTQEGTLMSSRQYEYDVYRKLRTLSLWSATAKVAEHAYTYNNDRLVKSEYKEYVGGQLQVIFEQVFEYKNERLYKVIVNHFNSPASYYIILNWDGGNIISQKRYELSSDQLTEETVYEYDDKINPYHHLDMPSDGNPRYSSVNNATKNTTTTIATGVTTQIVAEFEYDTSAQPVKQYNRFSDGRKLNEQSYTYH